MRYTLLLRLVFLMLIPLSWLSCGGALAPTVLNAKSNATGKPAASTSQPLTEADIYVSPNGNDQSGTGAQTKPYRTIGRALQDIPQIVSQHYTIVLAPGTYYEQVMIGGHLFATDTTTNFDSSSIEIRGNPGAADNYVISGATAAAPDVSERDYAVECSFANCVLNGVSVQHAVKAGLLVEGGMAVLNSITARHCNLSGASAVYVQAHALVELAGDSTFDSSYTGMTIEARGFVLGYRSSQPGDNVGTDILFAGLPDPGVQTFSNISNTAIAIGDGSFYDVSNSTVINCSGSGTIGISNWDYSYYDSERTVISGCQTALDSGLMSRTEFNTSAISNAVTGVSLENGASADFLNSAPEFTAVTTDYSLSGGAFVSSPNGTFFDGSDLNSTGPVNINSAGSINLTPSKSGSIVLNGLVGIGAPSAGAKLMISSPGGNQTYLDIADSAANNDTLINLNATGTPDGTYYLKAQSNGTDQWWVKNDGSMFTTSLTTGVNQVAFSSSPVFDASLGNVQKITLNGDVESSSLINTSNGQTLTFEVCQDDAGAHKFTWPPNVRGGISIGAVNPFGAVIGGAPNTCSVQQFVFTGALAYAVGPGSVGM